MTVRAASDEFGIADGVELAHQGITVGGVDRLAVSIMTVELEDGCRLGTVINPSPAVWRDVL